MKYAVLKYLAEVKSSNNCFLSTLFLAIYFLPYYVQLWGNKMIMPIMPLKDPLSLDG